MGYYSDSSLNIESNRCNEDSITSFIPIRSYEYISIGDDCYKNVHIFMIDGLYNLKSLKIGKNSFSNEDDSQGDDSSRSFHISNCIELESVEIGSYSFVDYGELFELKNLPHLNSIELGNYAFQYSLSTIISSI